MDGTTETGRSHAWDDVIDATTAAIYTRYARNTPVGQPFALLCIDNHNSVFGERREPILDAIERFPMTCGPAAWDAVSPTRALLAAARCLGAFVVHTGGTGRSSTVRATRRVVFGNPTDWSRDFFAELAPIDGELVLAKARASAFFGTELATILESRGVSDVIVCGNSTSGCVRATAVDAYNVGLNVTIAEECVFDRSPLSHKVNLFDLNAKYASVRFLDDVLAELAVIPASAPVSS